MSTAPTEPPVDPPLSGKAVVVTRPADRASDMVSSLEARGHAVLHLPAVGIEGPSDRAHLERAVADLERYDWVMFASGNGVRALAGAVSERSTMIPGRLRIAAVGPGTARIVRETLHREVDLMPEGPYSAVGLLDAFRRLGEPGGQRILLPAAEEGLDTLPNGLSALGAVVDRVAAYRTVGRHDGAARAAVSEGLVALLTFTSPSTAEAFLEGAGEDALALPCAVIGPVTAEAARGLGFRVVATASPHTIEGLVEAVDGWMRRGSRA